MKAIMIVLSMTICFWCANVKALAADTSVFFNYEPPIIDQSIPNIPKTGGETDLWFLGGAIVLILIIDIILSILILKRDYMKK